MALDCGVGCIVLDNLYELDLLDSLLAKRTRSQRVMLRINPGVDPHTHRHTSTGILDSKFGFPLSNGQAADAVKLAIDASHLELVGFHFHLGSPIFEMEPYILAIELVLKLAAELKNKMAFNSEISASVVVLLCSMYWEAKRLRWLIMPGLLPAR
jgi:diaminopimelate decarboxylase